VHVFSGLDKAVPPPVATGNQTPTAVFVRWWEIAVGLGLVSGRAPRTTLLFFLMQVVGTFLVFVEKPDVTFQGRNPLLLTTEGEFVVKNLILISAGIGIASTLHSRDE